AGGSGSQVHDDLALGGIVLALAVELQFHVVWGAALDDLQLAPARPLDGSDANFNLKHELVGAIPRHVLGPRNTVLQYCGIMQAIPDRLRACLIGTCAAKFHTCASPSFFSIALLPDRAAVRL